MNLGVEPNPVVGLTLKGKAPHKVSEWGCPAIISMLGRNYSQPGVDKGVEFYKRQSDLRELNSASYYYTKLRRVRYE